MPQLVSPKQVAQAIGVSESSLKRWCDRGMIESVRTAGGHRRLPLDGVLQFLRQTGQAMIRPELLGLPSNTGQGERIAGRAHDSVRDALIAGDDEQCRRIVVDLYLAGISACEICDRVLAPAMHDIGDLWACGEVEIYQERRACGICRRLVADLRSMIPAPPKKATVAIGAAPECDPYTLPTAMVETVLREAGWQAHSLGARLPFATLTAAVHDARPQVFWLSVSHIDDEQKFLAEYHSFYEQVRSLTAVVVGGRALSEALRRQMEYAAYGDNLQHLKAFARVWRRKTAHAKQSTIPRRFRSA